MRNMSMFGFDFDWSLVGVDFVRMLIAFALALPIGWERATQGRNLGMRTFPVVAVASCAYMLIAKHLPGATPDTMMRALQGLLGGIGFIGGGAILKQSRGSVQGLVTAASLWSTGAVGAAVAFDRVELALVLCLVNFLLLRYLRPLTRGLRPTNESSDSEDHDT